MGESTHVKLGAQTCITEVQPPVSPCPDFESHASILNSRLLNELDYPPDAYRVDRLLKIRAPGMRCTALPTFETINWCQTEDRKRASGLQCAADEMSLLDYAVLSSSDLGERLVKVVNGGRKQHALDLAHRLNRGSVATALPSALFKRELRLRLIGAFLQLLENRPPLPICLVRISHPEWEFRDPSAGRRHRGRSTGKVAGRLASQQGDWHWRVSGGTP
jgi:hypothetical protein